MFPHSESDECPLMVIGKQKVWICPQFVATLQKYHVKIGEKIAYLNNHAINIL